MATRDLIPFKRLAIEVGDLMAQMILAWLQLRPKHIYTKIITVL
jgi:hypothetical protein